jgi:DNA-binding SARP family transcriptional activator
VALDPESLEAHKTLSKAYAANHQEDAAMREYLTAEQLFQTVPPGFQAEASPLEKPERQISNDKWDEQVLRRRSRLFP